MNVTIRSMLALLLGLVCCWTAVKAQAIEAEELFMATEDLVQMTTDSFTTEVPSSTVQPSMTSTAAAGEPSPLPSPSDFRARILEEQSVDEDDDSLVISSGTSSTADPSLRTANNDWTPIVWPSTRVPITAVASPLAPSTPSGVQRTTESSALTTSTANRISIRPTPLLRPLPTIVAAPGQVRQPPRFTITRTTTTTPSTTTPTEPPTTPSTAITPSPPLIVPFNIEDGGLQPPVGPFTPISSTPESSGNLFPDDAVFFSPQFEGDNNSTAANMTAMEEPNGPLNPPFAVPPEQNSSKGSSNVNDTLTGEGGTISATTPTSTASPITSQNNSDILAVERETTSTTISPASTITLPINNNSIASNSTHNNSSAGVNIEEAPPPPPTTAAGSVEETMIVMPPTDDGDVTTDVSTDSLALANEPVANVTSLEVLVPPPTTEPTAVRTTSQRAIAFTLTTTAESAPPLTTTAASITSIPPSVEPFIPALPADVQPNREGVAATRLPEESTGRTTMLSGSTIFPALTRTPSTISPPTTTTTTERQPFSQTTAEPTTLFPASPDPSTRPTRRRPTTTTTTATTFSAPTTNFYEFPTHGGHPPVVTFHDAPITPFFDPSTTTELMPDVTSGWPSTEESNDPEPSTTTIVAVSVSVGLILCLALIILLMVVLRRRRARAVQGTCQPARMDAYSLDNVSQTNTWQRGKGRSTLRSSKRSYLNQAFDDSTIFSVPLTAAQLALYMEKPITSIEAEFRNVATTSTVRIEELPAGVETKNRYANVLPIPETRVHIRCGDNPPLDTVEQYINANYIKGPKEEPRYYIACQGPMDDTVEDFWQMIWENQCKIIVQLTDLSENGVARCAEYLPPSEVLDCHRLYGEYQVTLKSRELRDNYVTSHVQLKRMEDNLVRDITHLWYSSWPATGVPDDVKTAVALLLEARKGQSKEHQVPIVVHCSPGTGRTGAVLAIDVCLRQLDSSRSVDIPRCVHRLRQDRSGCVQTAEQYAFIYKAVNFYASQLSNAALDSL